MGRSVPCCTPRYRNNPNSAAATAAETSSAVAAPTGRGGAGALRRGSTRAGATRTAGTVASRALRGRRAVAPATARTTAAATAAAATGTATAVAATRGRLLGGDAEAAGDQNALAGSELLEDLVVRAGDLGGGRLDAGRTGQVPDVADLLVGHQRDDGASGTRARRTAGAVQVGLVL